MKHKNNCVNCKNNCKVADFRDVVVRAGRFFNFFNIATLVGEKNGRGHKNDSCKIPDL